MMHILFEVKMGSLSALNEHNLVTALTKIAIGLAISDSKSCVLNRHIKDALNYIILDKANHSGGVLLGLGMPKHGGVGLWLASNDRNNSINYNEAKKKVELIANKAIIDRKDFLSDEYEVWIYDEAWSAFDAINIISNHSECVLPRGVMLNVPTKPDGGMAKQFKLISQADLIFEGWHFGEISYLKSLEVIKFNAHPVSLSGSEFGGRVEFRNIVSGGLDLRLCKFKSDCTINGVEAFASLRNISKERGSKGFIYLLDLFGSNICGDLIISDIDHILTINQIEKGCEAIGRDISLKQISVSGRISIGNIREGVLTEDGNHLRPKEKGIYEALINNENYLSPGLMISGEDLIASKIVVSNIPFLASIMLDRCNIKDSLLIQYVSAFLECKVDEESISANLAVIGGVVYIHDCEVQEIKLVGLKAFDIELDLCRFRGDFGVSFDNSEIQHDIKIRKIDLLRGSLYAANCLIHGSVNISKSTHIPSIDLNRSLIGMVAIENVRMVDVILLNRCVIKESMRLSHLCDYCFNEAVLISANDAEIGGDVKIVKCRLRGVDVTGIKALNIAVDNVSRFKNDFWLRFDNAVIKHNICFRCTDFGSGFLHGRNSLVGGRVDIQRRSQLSSIDLSGSNIGELLLLGNIVPALNRVTPVSTNNINHKIKIIDEMSNRCASGFDAGFAASFNKLRSSIAGVAMLVYFGMFYIMGIGFHADTPGLFGLMVSVIAFVISLSFLFSANAAKYRNLIFAGTLLSFAVLLYSCERLIDVGVEGKSIYALALLCLSLLLLLLLHAVDRLDKCAQSQYLAPYLYYDIGCFESIMGKQLYSFMYVFLISCFGRRRVKLVEPVLNLHASNLNAIVFYSMLPVSIDLTLSNIGNYRIMTSDRIGGVEELNAVALLDRTIKYSRADYYRTELFYRARGESEKADDIFIRMHYREIYESSRRGAGISLVRVLHSFIGFGTKVNRILSLILFWSLLTYLWVVIDYQTVLSRPVDVFANVAQVIGTGEATSEFKKSACAVVSSSAEQCSDIYMLGADSMGDRMINSLFVTIRYHVPILEMPFAQHLQPSGRFKSYFFFVYLASWILWPLFVAVAIPRLLPRKEQ